MAEVSNPVFHHRVLAAVLNELVHRRRPTRDTLQELSGLSEKDVDEAMLALRQARAVVHDNNDVLVAAYPLSAVPTRHIVDLGFAAPWANCAIDALAVPAMVGQKGTVRSRCLYCDEQIVVEMGGASVRRAYPVGVVVAYGGLTDCADQPSVETRCPFINFFCSLEHAGAWRPPAAWQGRLMSINEAVAYAVEHFRPLIEVYSRYNIRPRRGRLG